jgi:hypothetical protein
VRDISDTDALRIEGDAGDTIRLENNVAGNALSGGTWVEGTTAYATGEYWTHFDYVFNGIVRASVSIDTDIDLLLVYRSVARVKYATGRRVVRPPAGGGA